MKKKAKAPLKLVAFDAAKYLDRPSGQSPGLISFWPGAVLRCGG